AATAAIERRLRSAPPLQHAPAAESSWACIAASGGPEKVAPPAASRREPRAGGSREAWIARGKKILPAQFPKSAGTEAGPPPVVCGPRQPSRQPQTPSTATARAAAPAGNTRTAACGGRRWWRSAPGCAQEKIRE